MKELFYFGITITMILFCGLIFWGQTECDKCGAGKLQRFFTVVLMLAPIWIGVWLWLFRVIFFDN